MTAFNPRKASASFDVEMISRPARLTARGARRSALWSVLAGWVAAFGGALREHLHRRRVIAELSRLTDRELADIGLSRSEIGLIYTAEFERRRNIDPNR